jgi:methylated-DNA-[protein]-cysteine S-methyltransferase
VKPSFHQTLCSKFGTFGIVWRETADGPRVYRIFLSNQRASSEELVLAAFEQATQFAHPIVSELGERIQSFLEGMDVDLPLDLMALETCSGFQRRVLLAERAIPRGRVSTYGRIGRYLGISGGARAVGNALARNPFPIVIPCHRAIRSNGALGGFQGGVGMKRALLEFEGVEVSTGGKVIARALCY